jgi:hypothetical protein
MNKSARVLVCLVLFLVLLAPALDHAVALPPLAAGTFPSGTVVVPMDNKQNDRIKVYGLIHEFLSSRPDAEVARVIEPPDVSMQTALTPTGAVYQGGPFLIEARFLGDVNSLLSTSPFISVTTTQLTASFTSNKIFFVRQTTDILVIRGVFGRTDQTLDRMGIKYTVVDPSKVENNPSLIDTFSLIVVDCPGWFGNPSTYASARRAKIQSVYDAIKEHVGAGNEVIFTDIALKDLDSSFPGYVTLGQGASGSWMGTVYNPPKGDNFPPEFPSQYYNPEPNPNSVKIFTHGGGVVVSGVQPAHKSDVRIVIDTPKFGVPFRYAILGFYFQYGNGIVEGLAFHPQDELYPTYADKNGYYAVHEIYGSKFVHGPQLDFMLSATPSLQTVAQGQTATYSVTVTSIGSFTAPVSLQVTGQPIASTAYFSSPSVAPPEGGTVSSTLIVDTTLSTPIGSYNLTLTGTSTLPDITRVISVMLIIQPAPSDFMIDADPKSPTPLIINVAQCGNVSVTVQSIGNFSLPVNLTLSNLPSHVTAEYVPNPVTPAPGGAVVSTLRFCADPNAAPDNYTMIVTGTAIVPSGQLTHTVDVLLRLRTIVPSGVNPLIYLIVLLLLLLALGFGLLAAFLSRKARRRPRVQYVLPLPTVRCRHCGRVMPLHAVYCPYCGRPQAVLARASAMMAPRVARGRVTRRGVVGFALSLSSGILVLLNSAAFLAPSFYGPPVNWSAIFWWLPSLGLSYAFVLGLIIGLVLILGSVIMILGHGAFADVLIFPFAVFSLIIGGGFVAGMVLGIVGGIVGALRK